MVKKFEFIKKAFLKVIFFIVAIVFLFFIANFRVSDYKKRLANAKLQLGTIELVKDLNNKIEVREKLLATIQRGRAPVYGLLKLISTLIPKEMVLNELIFDRQNHSLVFKGIIEGGAPAEDILTDFMRQLEKTSFILEASLVSSTHTNDVQRFEIRCVARLEIPQNK